MFIIERNVRLGGSKKRKKGSWDGKTILLIDSLLTFWCTDGI